MKKITIVIVDDHKLLRETLANLFSENNEIEITGESGTSEEAIEIIKDKRPEIVLLDINMPNGSGLDAVPVIKVVSPSTRIIVVSMYNQPVYAKKMMKLGAKAYVTKNSSYKELLIAIEEVMKGKLYICTEIKEMISNQVLKVDTNSPDFNDLSYREIEIIKLIKNGYSSKEIGVKLGVSTKTIEVHRYNILKKLKLNNTASLINFINAKDPYL